jgi:hypothetical protein
MVRGGAFAAVICLFAAWGSAAVADVGSSAHVASPARAPHCTEAPRTPQPELSYDGRGYRQIRLERSWLRVGPPLGVGNGPGDPGGGCGPLVCGPSPWGPPGVTVCTWTPRPAVPGPEIWVSRLGAFNPELAVSRGGSSRVIFVAESLCRSLRERALLRCLRSAR